MTYKDGPRTVRGKGLIASLDVLVCLFDLQTRKLIGEMSNIFDRLTKVLIQIVQIYVIFIHLKLWIVGARRNLK